jgi:hypothetical protein
LHLNIFLVPCSLLGEGKCGTGYALCNTSVDYDIMRFRCSESSCSKSHSVCYI